MKHLSAVFMLLVFALLIFAGCRPGLQSPENSESPGSFDSPSEASSAMPGAGDAAQLPHFPLDIKGERRMTVRYADSSFSRQELLIEENGSELLRHSPQSPETSFFRGGLGPDYYAFCTVQNSDASEEQAYELMWGAYGEQPRVLYSGSAPPNLLPCFFVVNQGLHCAAGVKNEVVVFEIGTGHASNIVQGLRSQLGGQDITVLSAEPFYNARQYGFFVENAGKAYFYFLRNGVITETRPLMANEKLLSAAALDGYFIACMQEDAPPEAGSFTDALIVNALGDADMDLARKEGRYYQMVSDGWGTALALDSSPMAEYPLCAIQAEAPPGEGVRLTGLDLPEGATPETVSLFCTGNGAYTLFDGQTGLYHEFAIEALLQKPQPPPADIDWALGPHAERSMRDVDIFDAEYAQYDDDPANSTSRLHFWNMQAIPKLGAQNTGTVELDYKNNVLNVLLVVCVSVNTGAPTGPLVNCSVDLTENKLVALRFEDWEGEVAEGKSPKFPPVDAEELLEWAKLFHDEIVAIQQKYS